MLSQVKLVLVLGAIFHGVTRGQDLRYPLDDARSALNDFGLRRTFLSLDIFATFQLTHQIDTDIKGEAIWRFTCLVHNIFEDPQPIYGIFSGSRFEGL